MASSAACTSWMSEGRGWRADDGQSGAASAGEDQVYTLRKTNSGKLILTK
ncbi:MAG: hemin uptake protein HemP [Gammaproteobacteria bacterium]